MLDIQIRNGLIIDGLGSPAFKGNLDIKKNRIVAVSKVETEAADIIDANGKYICPGFIDVHNHSDIAVMHKERIEGLLYQGVTTSVVGNCGFSAFPLIDGRCTEYVSYSAGVMGKAEGGEIAKDFETYAKTVDKSCPSMNICSLVGQGALHYTHLGLYSEAPTQKQLCSLCDVLDELLCQGAAGLSLGLIYTPGVTTTSGELRLLAEVVAAHGKILTVHLRNEGRHLIESMDEIFSLAEKTGVHVHFSHHKVMGIKYSGKSGESLNRILKARQSGLLISLDAYPYAAGCSTAMVLLPPWLLTGGTHSALELLENPSVRRRAAADMSVGLPGWESLVESCGWERLMIARTASGDGSLAGRTVADLAERKYTAPAEAFFDILRGNGGDVSVTINGMDERDVDNIMAFEHTLVGSDGLFATGSTHPRKYGSFARIVDRYVRQKGTLSIEDAVAKMTGKAADVFKIKGRGSIQRGYYADVAVLDLEEFKDVASFDHPECRAIGLEHLILNGRHIISNGQIKDSGGGMFIR